VAPNYPERYLMIDGPDLAKAQMIDGTSKDRRLPFMVAHTVVLFGSTC
jgi:hypothetical protein